MAKQSEQYGLPQPLSDALSPEQCTALRATGAQVDEIGQSQEGRPLHGVSVGARHAPLVTIVAGAHPDEPAGPLAALQLLRLWSQSPLARQVRLAVVPLLDVDGVVAQRQWLQPWREPVDLSLLQEHRLRRLPGEDREFAWPGAPWSGPVLPECRAAADFFTDQGGPIAHCSLHGMLVAAGAWFLLNRPALRDAQLWRDLRGIAADQHFGLHDMPRHGEKGFRRVGDGFCTVPSGPAMRRWWCAQQQSPSTAPGGFAWGSMDFARHLARRHGLDDPLCAVSEFPLLRWRHCHGRSLSWMREHLPAVLQDPAGPLPAMPVSGGQLQAMPVSGGQLQAMPMQSLVTAMVAMVEAVIAAALRRTRMRL